MTVKTPQIIFDMSKSGTIYTQIGIIEGAFIQKILRCANNEENQYVLIYKNGMNDIIVYNETI